MNNDFTVDNFCSAISSSRPTIYRMIKSGELFAYKVRNSTRIPFSELARIQQENQIKPSRTNHTEGC
jgi:excisionase family DNA binding protein